MDSSNYFTITLHSSDKSDPQNTIASFTTHLGREKILDGNWVVGLSELHYTKSWYNIDKDFAVIIEDSNGNFYHSKKKVGAGFYDSESSLVNAIKQSIEMCSTEIKFQLNRTRDDSTADIKLPFLEFDQRSRRMSMFAGHSLKGVKLFLILPYEIEQMLGLSQDRNTYDVDEADTSYSVEDISNDLELIPKKPKKKKTKLKIVSELIKGEEDGFTCYDLNSGIHSLFVYCNLIDSVIVGNSFAPLLRAIPVQNLVTSVIRFTRKPYFYPLASNNFQIIQTSIKDKTGKLIPFKFGETTLVLEFKKI